MGKGFNNFMSKKDFHPSAIWNLKAVWEARQKTTLEQKKQDDMRAQYEKEQEVLNNKALLGDEKAKIGLSFMYDAPAGISKEKDKLSDEVQPRFEWQRKYNAPREEWDKGNTDIHDQPFGIQVRNVRCVKCHTWGHLNTDNECPLFNMSGNHDDPGFCTNPSDLIRANRKKGESSQKGARKQSDNHDSAPRPSRSFKSPPRKDGNLPKKGEKPPENDGNSEEKKERMDPRELDFGMRDEYGLSLRKHVMDGFTTDLALSKMGKAKPKAEPEDSEESEKKMMFQFLQSLSEKERAKIFNKFFDSSKKDKKNRKKDKKNKDKKAKKIKKEIKSEPKSPEDERKNKRSYDFSQRSFRAERIKQEPLSPRNSSYDRDRQSRSDRYVNSDRATGRNERNSYRGSESTRRDDRRRSRSPQRIQERYRSRSPRR